MMVVVQFMSLLPKNAFSFAFGWLSRQNLPSPLNRWLCRVFAILFNVDTKEAARPLESFKNLEEFFIRELKPGVRPMTGSLNSPADGTIVYSRSAEAGNRAVQVKGIYYSLDELVCGQGVQGSIQFSWFTTIYLAPHNYHRIHAPVTAKLEQMRYIPGELWPVNKTFVKFVPKLFVNNERVIFEFSLKGGGQVVLVMVGAFNVGRITSPFWEELVTNDRLFGNYAKTKDFGHRDLQVQAGDEIGTFMLGSTVVVLLDEKACSELKPKRLSETNQNVLVGQNLGEDCHAAGE